MTAGRRLAFSSALALTAVAAVIGVSGGTARTRAVSASALRGGDPLYYVDPMHPSYTSPTPGTAPDCGMALVPVYQQDRPAGSPAGSATTIQVDAARQQVMGVQVITARRRAARHELRLYARVTPDQTRVYKVNVGIDGFIRKLSDAIPGSQVSEGQWLATFSAPESRTAIQSYVVAVDAAARARESGDGPGQLAVAEAGIAQARDRLLNFGMSPGQIERLGRTRLIPADIQIASPVSGFVLERNITAGERFVRGAQLYVIADLRRVWIEAELVGPVAIHVRPGMAAEVHVPGLGTVQHAVVSSTLPEFDPATQSLKLRLEAENRGIVLRPGMFVDATLAIDLPPAIAVPVDAVMDAGTGKRVFIERAAGVFEARDVSTGWRVGGNVEIVNGIAEGDRVLVSGAFLFDSESRMRQSRAYPAAAR